MIQENRNWFVGERSEALASILLRSQGDIRIVEERDADEGVDFLVDVNQASRAPLQCFAVQVKGTLLDDPQQRLTLAKESIKTENETRLIYPTCLFVFNVRDRASYYAWVAEPIVENHSAKLRIAAPDSLSVLDQDSIQKIIQRVRDWYSAVPQNFVPTSPA